MQISRQFRLSTAFSPTYFKCILNTKYWKLFVEFNIRNSCEVPTFDMKVIYTNVSFRSLISGRNLFIDVIFLLSNTVILSSSVFQRALSYNSVLHTVTRRTNVRAGLHILLLLEGERNTVQGTISAYCSFTKFPSKSWGPKTRCYSVHCLQYTLQWLEGQAVEHRVLFTSEARNESQVCKWAPRWSRVFLEKGIVALLVRKCSAFYGDRLHLYAASFRKHSPVTQIWSGDKHETAANVSKNAFCTFRK